METTKELGPVYIGWVRFDRRFRPPLVEPGWSNEVEPPFRRGRCISVRVRPGLCVVLGIWFRPKILPAEEFAYLDEDEQDDMLEDLVTELDETPEAISTWTAPDWEAMEETC